MSAQADPNILPINNPPPGWVYRFSIEQYRSMIDKGVLREGDATELIHGYLITKMPKNEPHAFSTGSLEDVIRPQLRDGFIYRSQDPITLSDSEPEPDAVVARGTRRDYLRSHPTPADICLVIEVADATLAFDRSTKKSLYAASGIAAYWIVNVVDRVVETFSRPTDSGEYAEHHVYQHGEDIELVVDGRPLLKVSVASLFP